MGCSQKIVVLVKEKTNKLRSKSEELKNIL